MTQPVVRVPDAIAKAEQQELSPDVEAQVRLAKGDDPVLVAEHFNLQPLKPKNETPGNQG